MSDNVRIANLHIKPNGTMQSLTVSTSVVTLTLTNLPAGTRFILWSLRGGPVRLTIDGTDPSSTVGHTIFDGSGEWATAFATKVRLIRDSTVGADAVLTYTPCTD